MERSIGILALPVLIRLASQLKKSLVINSNSTIYGDWSEDEKQD
jgi:hypothetical protein